MVDKLNDLMEKKKRNEAQRDEFFAKRKQMMMDNVDQEDHESLKEKLKQRQKEMREQRQKK